MVKSLYCIHALTKDREYQICNVKKNRRYIKKK